MAKKNYEFIEVWKAQVSERAQARISRMFEPEKEKAFYISEEYLRKGQSKKEYEQESKRRLQIKKDTEKYFINAQVDAWDGGTFLTKGFSISRKKIPLMIEALQQIIAGDSDDYMNKILIESGIMKKSQHETQVDDPKEKEKNYDLWYKSLTKAQKADFKKMESSGWTKDEIKNAIEMR